MNQMQRLAALVCSPQNLALPEAERLRMPHGWTIWDTGNWHRIHAGRNIETGQLCHQILRLEDATDLEAASGVLAEWLALKGYAADRLRPGDWAVYDTGDCPDVLPGTRGNPTMLDAQLAAAEAVLGVGR